MCIMPKPYNTLEQKRDEEFSAGQRLGEGAEEVFVKGNSFIPKGKAIEPVFEARLFDGIK